MSKHILSLASQSDLDWLKRHDTEVAIKEAEWWADFDPLDVDTQDQWDLIAAERIAELRKLAGSDVSAKDGEAV